MPAIFDRANSARQYRSVMEMQVISEAARQCGLKERGLLGGAVEGEFAVVDAPRQAIGHRGYRVFAIGRNEIAQRCEQRGIGQHFGLYAVMKGLFPGVHYVA